MQKFWENDPIAGEQQGEPKPIFTVPDPIGEQDRARDNRDEQRDVAAEGRAERGEQRQVDDTAFSRASTYRTEFLNLPDVKQFRDVRNATQQIVSLTETEGSAMGDLGLVFSYMKALDPGSTVREGEQASAQNAGGIPTQIRNAYNSLVSGERLSPTQRADMARVAQTILNSRAHNYNEVANTYRGLLENEGFNPNEQGVTLFEIPAREPTQQDVYADGIEFGMDRWGDESPFNRREYLRDQYGLESGDEAIITAFWNKNRGNANLTPRGVAAWYAENGLPIPTAEEIERGIAGAREGKLFGPFETEDAAQEYVANLDRILAERGADPESMSGAVGAKAAQGIVMGAGDEVAGVSGFIGELLRGGNPVGGYQVERDVARREQERAFNAHPIAGTIAELGGGAVTGGAAFRGVNTARDAARIAAAEGALTGFNYGEGAGGSALSAAGGAALGLGAQRLGKAATDALAARHAARTATPSEGKEVIRAADRVNASTGSDIRPLPADVGSPTIRRATGGAAQSTFGAAPIVNAGQRVQDESASALNTIASREGDILAPQGAGERAIQGGAATIKQTGTKVDTLYARARKLAGDTRVPLPNAKAALNGHIAELADTPGGAKSLKRLEDLAEEINGDWPVEGIKRMRSQLRQEFIKDGLRGSDLERRVLDVIDQADFDIEQGLVNAGRADAAAAYQKASKAASERYSLIDEVLTPVLGKKGDQSGEKAFQAIDRLSRGDAVTLGKFMKALPAEEAGAVRASLIARLGRATKGQQDASGEAFSLSKFLTNWNDEGLSAAAKSALFGGELRAALDDLARVAQGTKEAQGYANHSNTAGGNAFNAILNGAPIGAAFFDIPTAAAAATGSVVIQAVAGKALASPGFARWLAKMPKQKTAGAVKAHIGRLERIAANDAVIATEALGLQRQLMAMFEPAKLAAETGEPVPSADSKKATEGGIQ